MYTVQFLILRSLDVTFIGDSRCSYSLLQLHVTTTFRHHLDSFDDWPHLAQGMQKHSKVRTESLIWYCNRYADSGSVLVVISNV